MSFASFLGRDAGNTKIKNFVKRYGVNAIDNNGNTLLHIIDDYHLIQWLLDNGADSNIKNNEGHVPLQPARSYYYACLTFNNQPNSARYMLREHRFCELLLKAGANPNFVIEHDELTPNSKDGPYSSKSIQLLVDYGANQFTNILENCSQKMKEQEKIDTCKRKHRASSLQY